VLGGFAQISPLDIRDSKAFIAALQQCGLRLGTAIDCGAGIGRITSQLLLPLFQTVDLVEQNPAYVAKAQELIKAAPNMRHFFTCGLQSFMPAAEEYDVIWIQWVIGHLPDDRLVDFLKRCRTGLKPDGFIVLKENVCKQGFSFDDEDGSVTRSDKLFKRAFDRAGLQLAVEAVQKEFPRGLFPVRMYALR